MRGRERERKRGHTHTYVCVCVCVQSLLQRETEIGIQENKYILQRDKQKERNLEMKDREVERRR